MASLVTVRINKGDSPNLGFRLQGGKDFGTPLVVQKVNGGSPAERAGLSAGDSVIKINNTDVFNLRHKDAQDVVVRAGPSFEVTIQRGGSTWKPSVVPTGSFGTPNPNINNISPVTKTSLSAKPSESIGAIGTGHNLSAKPFNSQVNGVNGGPTLVNKQYNTPVKLYSEESIAETLSAQTEVLSTGALGVNFKKNEKNYDASNSAVLRMLKEAENEPKNPEEEPDSGVVTAPNSGTAGLRHVKAPENRPAPATPQLPPGQNICSDCERLIVGVFVRIKDKNLHVECFKCATCGSSLKNVGYYNINNKLYCDIHAKAAAIRSNSSPGLVPVTVPPGGKAPASAISSALSSHSLPSPSPLSPKLNTNNSIYESSSNLSGPKPFSSVSSPLSPSRTLPKTGQAPLSPVTGSYNAPSYSSPSSAGQSVHNIIWPPPFEELDVPTACPLFYPPPSQVEKLIINKRKQTDQESEDYNSLCCQELEEINNMAQFHQSNSQSEETVGFCRRKSTSECLDTIFDSLETQKLVENILQSQEPSPVTASISSEPYQEITKPNIQNLDERVEPASSENICSQRIVCQQPNRVDNTTPQKWESLLTQASRTTAPDRDTFAQIPSKCSFTPLASALAVAPAKPFYSCSNPAKPVSLPEETVPYFPPERPVLSDETQEPDLEIKERKAPKLSTPFKKKGSTDNLLAELPKPQEKLSMLAALTTAPERPYTPIFVQNVGSMENSTDQKVSHETQNIDRSQLQRPLKPEVLPESFKVNKKDTVPPNYYYPSSVQYQKTEESKSEEHSEEVNTSKTIKKQTIRNPETIETFKQQESHVCEHFPPIFQGFSCSFQNKTDHSQFSVEISTTPPILSPPKSSTPTIKITESKPGYTETETITEETRARQHIQQKEKNIKEIKQEIQTAKQQEEVILKKAVPPVVLHKAMGLPQYQVQLSETAEADLLLMERKKEKSENQLQIQKLSQQQVVQKDQSSEQLKQSVHPQQSLAVKRPCPKLEQEDSQPKQFTFKPVIDERPPNRTFSPRPGSVTPSMINRPPPVLPYYQANLVSQRMAPLSSNLLDPRTPATSRTPSPCPGAKKERSLSPAPLASFAGASNLRPVSPAQGPPQNPLQPPRALSSLIDSKIEKARENITSFIPEYKSKCDIVEKEQGKVCGGSRKDEVAKPIQMYTSQVQTQNALIQQEMSSRQSRQCQEHIFTKADQQTSLETSFAAISEQSQKEHFEKQQQNKSVQKSADGLTQVQRKKTITEEYEHTRNETNIEIEKHTTKNYPFREINAPVDESFKAPSVHLTDPRGIGPSLTKSSNDCCRKSSSSQQDYQKPNQKMANVCEKSIDSAQPSREVQASTPAKHVSFPSSIAPGKRVQPPDFSRESNQNVIKPNVSQTDVGAGGGRQSGGISVAPKRGRGVLNAAAIGSTRVPLCGSCNMHIRGPFITALGKIWCPNHFVCATPSCKRPLQDLGFVEERGQLYCEYCFEQYLAPPCSKCSAKIKGDCVKAIGKNFHPECFNCVYCGKLFGNSPFFLEDGSPYCEADWNELFTTKCFACGFPVEAGDRWVEALNNNYHSQCFNCTMCKKNLEGQSFFAKGGRPFCKNHAR